MGALTLLTHALLLAASVLQAQPAPGEIHGTVTGQRMGVNSPLGYAIVEVVGPEGTRATVTDHAGRYAVDGLAAGAFRLRASYVGYEDARVEVVIGGGSRVNLDLTLSPKPVELPGILVNARPLTLPALPGTTREASSDRALAEITLRALEVGPGLAESGVGEAARQLPGNEPSDPTDVLFMRGSTADLKLVLLDGAPVYAPFHLGGLLRSFDAEVLGSATHHVGGAPARYDGGLSYVLDLRTRSPSRTTSRWTGGLDLMSARTSAEVPLGERAGVLFSSRALHGLQSRMAGGGGAPYGYLDGLVKAEVDLFSTHRLSLMAFANDESVRLGLGTRGQAEPAVRGWFRGPRPDQATWGNQALSMTYSGAWGRSALDVSASASHYGAELPLLAWRNATFGADAAADFATGQSTLVARGETRRARLAADAVRLGSLGALRVGASADRLDLRFGATRLGADAGPDTYDRSANGDVLGAYVDLNRQLVPELHLRVGGRMDHFRPGGTRGALRLALLWNLTDDALLTLAGGRYHQLIRTTDPVELQLAVGDAATAGTGGLSAGLHNLPLLTVATGDHLVLSLDQQLTPAVRLTTEGFYKRFEGLDGVGPEDLNASGVDLRVLREGERVTGWLGYSLSWFWDSPNAAGQTEEFTGRHLLNVGLRTRITQRWGVDLQLAYSDGLPLTSIPFAAGRGDQLTPAPLASQSAVQSPVTRTAETFLRLDAELFADLEPGWRGRTVRLRPYLRVLNALDRRDALFYYFEPWRDPNLRPLAEMSVIPVLGLEWRF